MNDSDDGLESEPEASPLPQASGPAQTTSFEEGLIQLGEIVTGLESGGLGLSESIDAYERGVALLRQLHEELSRVEARVHVLVRIDEEGRPVLAPAEGGEPDAEQRRPAKRAARSKATRSRPLPGMDEASDEP